MSEDDGSGPPSGHALILRFDYILSIFLIPFLSIS